MKIERNQVLPLMLSSAGTFMSITSEKKDGTLRNFNCRLGVSKWVKGVKSNFEEDRAYNLVTVWDRTAFRPVWVKGKASSTIIDYGYRRIRLEGVKKMKIKGQEYEVIK